MPMKTLAKSNCSDRRGQVKPFHSLFPVHRCRVPIIGVVIVSVLWGCAANVLGIQVDIVHSFSSGEGKYPTGELLAIGSTLYGVTLGEQSKNGGVVFAVDVDGSDYHVLHKFPYGGPSSKGPEGHTAQSGLVVIGSRLYGTTTLAGEYGSGTIYALDTSGENYEVLHHFRFGVQDGASPLSSLTPIGGVLYGTTSGGGIDIFKSNGTIYALDADGANYHLLHSFSTHEVLGYHLQAPLRLSDSQLYGAAAEGGTFGHGTVFKLGLDGGIPQVLYDFQGGLVDGSTPTGQLLKVGSRLFGTTFWGGSANMGTVFAVNADGGDYEILHQFDGQNGAHPLSGLTLVGSTLFGTTTGHNTPFGGSLFSIDLDGSDFQDLHSFPNAAVRGGLVLVGSKLYGLSQGDGANHLGTVYSVTVPEPSSLILALTCAVCLLALKWKPRRR